MTDGRTLCLPSANEPFDDGGLDSLPTPPATNRLMTDGGPIFSD
jgi:hypothetical protein